MCVRIEAVSFVICFDYYKAKEPFSAGISALILYREMAFLTLSALINVRASVSVCVCLRVCCSYLCAAHFRN